jgi:hypothetical protein
MLAFCVSAISRKPIAVSASALPRPASSPEQSSAAPYALTYTKDGDLVPPVNQYREWVYLTSGLGMSYTAGNSSDAPSFDNVFVNPEAYRSFLANGTWPDKTVLVLEGRRSSSKSSINKTGHFQSGEMSGMEVHVKDEARFPGKWAFFDVSSETKATLFPKTANCYSCHTEHAAVDTTFVQFYPTLLPIAQKKGTLSTNYLKEIAAEPER